ncbi:phenylpropionate dioxygenase-like ring-hydroxylating dioxygenase large terminal subunit [Pseudomonas baetica]|uniref:Phenylpropionate dioxygenase-like ring-hydroxylating dioxygenase large terminal subunit n=2 Tax=Pseudomonas baetica TaxID=674054 RepID=A0ABX4PVN1_9PSED|nr:phenylpropionate dioxygenase-like ring-hydroxylating dioxygenase large terminal subunit [Pseudomonas baetica]
MDHQTQVLLIKEIFNLLEQGSTSLAQEPFLNPVSVYHCTDHLALEQAGLFDASPLLMGLSSQLDHPGAYLTDDLCGVPVVIIRTAEGRLSAFINVCRHRGARLLEGQGTLKNALTCPYHGWMYNLQGQLVQLAPAGSFPGLQCADRNLVSLPVIERHGLIWGYRRAGKPVASQSPLGALDAEIGHFLFEGFSLYETRLLEKPFNWKNALETFFENWHFPFLHQNTVASIFLPAVSQFEAFGNNARLVMPRRTILGLRDQPAQQWDLLKHSLVIYFLFPNTLLLWQRDHLEVWRVFPKPQMPDACLAQVSLYTPHKAVTAREREIWDKNMKLLLETVDGEDFEVSAKIQQGIASGAQTHLTYGRNEPALQHFHRMIQQALAAYRAS